MIPKKYVTWGSSGAVIRELAAYGAERAKVVGPENVYDFTIGSPSIEPPKKFFDVLDTKVSGRPSRSTCPRASDLSIPRTIYT